MDLRAVAREIARHGGSDSVLAHISPREAAELAEKYGGNVNPTTGLPSFDFWSRIGRAVEAPTRWMGDATNRVWNSRVGDWAQKITPKPLRSMVHTGLNEAASGAFPGAIPGASGTVADLKQQGLKTEVGNDVQQAAALYAGYQGAFDGSASGSQYAKWAQQLVKLFGVGGAKTPQQQQQAQQYGTQLKSQLQKEYQDQPLEEQQNMQAEMDYIDRLLHAITVQPNVVADQQRKQAGAG